MNSVVTRDFIDCFARLPDEVKELARRAYRTWRSNPSHPGLRFKPVRGHSGVYSVRIGRGWRALGKLEASVMTWFWIGSHADYYNLIG